MRRPFRRWALLTTAATYFLILVGGLVRASGAGLGCPDWPRCFGSWIPPSSADQLPPQFDRALFNPTLTWTEYVNRLIGVTVGFLIFATVISAWRHHRREPKIFWPSIAAFLLVGYEGWLGGRVVAHELAPWIVTAHLIFALVIVQLLLYATIQSTHPRTRSATHSSERVPIIILIAVTLVQIAIGTQVRGGVDAALNANIARNAALATVGSVDMFHRTTSLLVLFGSLGLLAWRQTRWTLIVAALAVAQVALGVTMAYIALAPAAQVAHLTVASLLLGAQTVLLLTLSHADGKLDHDGRRREPAPGTSPRSH